MTDTIFAPATAPGRAAVAVMRLSGSGSGEALRGLAGPLPPPRRATLRTLRGADGEALDRALVLWMPAPASFTGEDCAELHLHGGPAVVAGVTQTLVSAGLRLAEAGEFTRRAFENGRMDLVEAEGVADLVDAETDAQRRQALDQLGGRSSARHAAWRETLTTALANLEAEVDFPDEELPPELSARVRAPLRALLAELEAAASDRRGEQVREGLRIALVGAPNAGKSSLLNALLGRDAAIVTPVPGTTRDVLEGRLLLAGVPAVLADTAGLRDTVDIVEREGVRRARAWATAADLRLWVIDGSAPSPTPPPPRAGEQDWILLNKSDLPAHLSNGAGGLESPHLIQLSAHSRPDVDALHRRLNAWATCKLAGAEPPAATRLRHRLALEDAARALSRALEQAREPELVAEEVRLAARALERLTGRIRAEEVLDSIFASFCIGK